MTDLHELPRELFNAQSVGTVVKKIIAINPDLGAQEIIDLVKKSTRKRDERIGAFSGTELVDETLALELARRTLNS